VDEAVWEDEREQIFARSWVCICSNADVCDGAGSYALKGLAGEQILLVRGPDNGLRAFANLCRHRGAELVDSTDDSALHGCFGSVIKCPYHHWTYGIDGALRGTPHLEMSADERASRGLIELAVGTWGGFVFVDQSGQAGPLEDHLGDAPRRTENYALAQLQIGVRRFYDVAANWKVIAENYNECYHCGPVHPELCDLVPSFRRGGGVDLDWEGGIPHRDGAYTFTTTGTTKRAPFPGLSPDERVNHKGELVLPNLLVSLSCDHVVAFVLLPHGAARTRVICDFLFHPSEALGDDFDPHDAVDFWDVVNRQDWSICERVQRGMTSRHFERGLFAPVEDPSLDIRRWWAARMGPT
jgi:glycine betaine catabolism A